MDPVTALGVVASVVQFVEFTGKLVYGTCVIYKNAKNGEETHSDIETIAENLRQLAQELVQSPISHKGTDKQLSERENSMRKLCQNCQETATELIGTLEKLKSVGQPSYWLSFRKALATVWRESEIQGLQKRLDSFRQQISLQVLVSVRYEFGSSVWLSEKLSLTSQVNKMSLRLWLSQVSVSLFKDQSITPNI